MISFTFTPSDSEYIIAKLNDTFKTKNKFEYCGGYIYSNMLFDAMLYNVIDNIYEIHLFFNCLYKSPFYNYSGQIIDGLLESNDFIVKRIENIKIITILINYNYPTKIKMSTAPTLKG